MTPIFMTSPLSGAAFGALTVLCWAGFNVAAKAGIDAGLSPAALSFLRFLTPGLAAVPIVIWMRHRSLGPRLPLSRLLVLALLGGPVFGLIAVAGYQFALLSNGLLIAPVAVYATGTARGVALLQERVSGLRSLGGGVMIGGLALLVGVEICDLDPA
ncbi:MAG: hypothetical protein AAGA32_22630 [Pseudomonadota bacterium]